MAGGVVSLGDAGSKPQAALLDHARSWYAVQTRYRFEKRVVKQLQEKAVETFLPLRQEVHHWSDRSKEINIPLFSRYAFVRIDKSRSSRLRVLQTAGVIGFVSLQGEAVSIPNGQIESLSVLLARKVPCSLYPFLKVGQRVRVRGGCLHGLEGILLQNGRRDLVISIDSIQRSVVVALEGYELEPI